MPTFRFSMRLLTCGVALMADGSLLAGDVPTTMTNSLGMKFVQIEPGSFLMGQVHTPLPAEVLPLNRGRGRLDDLASGDYDEHTVHEVTVSRPFYMGAYEVTNAEYERYDADHRRLRGQEGFSTEDDEAVVYVSWYDAHGFCQWLADKEGLPYRLPTEAEWEYACRTGTTTHFHTGDVLSASTWKHQQRTGGPQPVALKVGTTPPNAWGLFDMHGNVEEWCLDWYGPYRAEPCTDPVGYSTGDFRVTRGGSRGTPMYYLRSANRMATVPEDRHFGIGFRVVLGELPAGKPLPSPPRAKYQEAVVERSHPQVSQGPDPSKPYFKGPRKYVHIPTDAHGPLFAEHNHDPAIVACPNGDLLAVWYTCISESDRELAQAASRLRWGQEEWEAASVFWDTPDRNDHAPALWYDGKDTLYHFSGLAFAGGHYYMTTLMRTSQDNGATWSRPRMIIPRYARHFRMPSEPVFRRRDGAIVLVVDAADGSGLWISNDEAKSWTRARGTARGIHAGVVELKDKKLLAFGRGEGGKLPKSISEDQGQNWVYSDSEFPAIGGGQRLVLIRLRQGPIMLASFADLGIPLTDASGSRREVRGLYVAVSTDEGKTWPYKRLVSDDGPGRAVECTEGGLFTMSGRNAEYRGYLAACQGANGSIHLISSRQHYTFNLKWAMTPPPPLAYPPVRVSLVVETFAGPERFDADGWVDYSSYSGRFTESGCYTIDSRAHINGINRVLGAGSFELTAVIKNIDYYDPGPQVSEGATVSIMDARARSVAFTVKEDHVELSIKDADRTAPLPGGRFKNGVGWLASSEEIRYQTPPSSAEVRLVWDESTRQMRIFYGLNGDKPATETKASRGGIILAKPLSECTTARLLMSNGKIDMDHFEVKPLDLPRS